MSAHAAATNNTGNSSIASDTSAYLVTPVANASSNVTVQAYNDVHIASYEGAVEVSDGNDRHAPFRRATVVGKADHSQRIRRHSAIIHSTSARHRGASA